jgi:hypothetical protein
MLERKCYDLDHKYKKLLEKTSGHEGECSDEQETWRADEQPALDLDLDLGTDFMSF